MNNNNISFEISKKGKTKSKENKEFFKTLILPNLFIIGILMIFIIIYNSKQIFTFSPIAYIALFIIMIQILVFILIRYNSKKIIRIEFENNYILITYTKRKNEYQESLLLNSTEINLFEVKDHKSHFAGIQIDILKKLTNEKYKIYDSKRSYQQMEDIYNEYKTRKSEKVRDSEIAPLNQLKLMNRAKNVL